MPSVSSAEPICHRDLPGVEIFPMSGSLRAGEPQRVLVKLAPFHRIPLHTHMVDAAMFIVAGGGEILSQDALSGRQVAAGDRVLFERDAPHGFAAGAEGLAFVSDNGGIVDETAADSWDLAFS